MKRSARLKLAIAGALLLLAVAASPGSAVTAAGDTVSIELRVWQDVQDDLREMYRDRAQGLGVSFEELWESVLAHTPLRKHALHEEVANAALFLASSDSSHTTGEALNVSGGRLMS